MSLKNKTVMVTGGAGFIGSHLVDRIIRDKPERIVVVDNFFLGKHRNLEPAIKTFGNIKIYYQDAGHYGKMKNIMDIEGIDVVFNLAVVPLLTSHELPKITCEDNINITLSVLELLREGKYKTLIHCSSSEAYGTAESVPMSESHPLNPTTPYAASKAASDLLAQSYENTFGLDISIVRPFNNYGPRQNEFSYAGVIPITIERIMSGMKPVIHGDGLQTRDYIYVSDTVEAMLQICQTKSTRGKVVNIATGREITILDMIKAISMELDYTGEFEYQPARLADVRRHRGDITLARKLMGFEPATKFTDGIAQTVSWYKTVIGKQGEA